MRTLTFHPHREHVLQDRVDARPYHFGDVAGLARSLEGVTNVYNTYWVRFDRGRTTFAGAVENSRALFFAARRAGADRVIHLSIANPSLESPLPYFRGKALTEHGLGHFTRSTSSEAGARRGRGRVGSAAPDAYR